MAELDDLQLVDVRTDAEYVASHLAGARHVPLDQIPSVAAELDAERPLVFYCRVGERSALAAEAFRGAGFDAYSLAGWGRGATWRSVGLLRWAPGLRLDHIYLSEGLTCSECYTGNRTGSDHRPVVARIGCD